MVDKKFSNIKDRGISIVIGTYNRKFFLKQTIRSIRNELSGGNPPCEIIVIDGGSTDGTLKWLARQKDIITIIQHNRGDWQGKQIERRSWGYFMNLGFKTAIGKYVCMLSDDCLVVPGAILNGYQLFNEKIGKGEKVGAVAFYWRNWPEQKKYWVGLTLGGKMFVNHGMYSKKALEDVGYADEDTYFFYHADGDLCLKMWQAGYECIDSPDSFVEHYSHTNIKQSRYSGKDDWEKYLNKWKNIFCSPAQNNDGGWIEKDHFDASHTANGFKYIKFTRWFL